MDPRFLTALLRLGWRGRWLRFVSSSKPIVLMYHGTPRRGVGAEIDAELFERHVVVLKQHFDLVDHQSLGRQRRRGDPIQVLLTFDDSLKNNYDVAAPILRKHRTPAIFFACTRHSEKGKYLWFAYLNALERFFPHDVLTFRGRPFDMSSASKRVAAIAALTRLLLDLTPHPSGMYQAIEEELPRLESFMTDEQIDDQCAGMTTQQIAELSKDPLFTIGAHTSDHPFLSRCGNEEAASQIQTNIDWIERTTGKSCRLVAYPSGDYNRTVLDCCDALGITQGFSIIPRLRCEPMLEIPRVGLYEPSSDVLGFKVQWGHWVRALDINAW